MEEGDGEIVEEVASETVGFADGEVGSEGGRLGDVFSVGGVVIGGREDFRLGRFASKTESVEGGEFPDGQTGTEGRADFPNVGANGVGDGATVGRGLG